MSSNKLWSALTHYNTLVIKYSKKYNKPNHIQNFYQQISRDMHWFIISITDRNDASIHHAIAVELHRDLKTEGIHCWYDYRVMVRAADFSCDDDKTEWRKLEEIIIGGDE